MSQIIKNARKVFSIEIRELEKISRTINHDFEKAILEIINTQGRVVVTGMGKSGLIGQKIAASLASTGTTSFFVHSGEAYHGDLGMFHQGDIVIAVSNSGETDEILQIISFLRENKIKIIALTGNEESTLALNSDFVISTHVEKEACPLNLAPTSSTTAALVIGDAITVALMKRRNFAKEAFARFHPGGNLGKKLLTHVGDVMRTHNLPFVEETISNEELLVKMSEGKLGMALIGNPENLRGVITDGDLRRGLIKFGSLTKLNIIEHMTCTPVIVQETESIQAVEDLMKQKKISTVIVERNGIVAGTYQIYSE